MQFSLPNSLILNKCLLYLNVYSFEMTKIGLNFRSFLKLNTICFTKKDAVQWELPYIIEGV